MMESRVGQFSVLTTAKMLRKILFEPKELNPEFRVDDWMRVPTLLLQLTAMAHSDFTRWLPAWLSSLSPLLNYAIFIFVVLGLLHIIALFGLQIYLHESDGVDQVITNAISQIIIYSFALFAISYFQLKRKDYARLCEYMKRNFRKRSAPGLTFVTGQRIYFHVVRLDLIWTFTCVYATLQWAFGPILKEDQVFPVTVDYPFLDQKVKR